MTDDILEKISSIWRNFSEVFGIFSLLTYVIGFIVWNKYLGDFGFFEYNLIQARYISAGLLFIIIWIIVSRVIIFFLHRFRKHEIRIIYKNAIALLIIISLVYFSTEVFLLVPQWLGGGKPVATSILGTSEQIEYLKDLNFFPISNAGNPSIQTRACLFYQNNDYVLIGSYSRILSISRSSIIGFQTVKGFNNTACLDLLDRKD